MSMLVAPLPRTAPHTTLHCTYHITSSTSVILCEVEFEFDDGAMRSIRSNRERNADEASRGRRSETYRTGRCVCV